MFMHRDSVDGRPVGSASRIPCKDGEGTMNCSDVIDMPEFHFWRARRSMDMKGANASVTKAEHVVDSRNQLLILLERFYCQSTVSSVYPDVLLRLQMKREHLRASEHRLSIANSSLSRILRAALRGLDLHIRRMGSSQDGMDTCDKSCIEAAISSRCRRIAQIYDELVRPSTDTSMPTLWRQLALPNRLSALGFSLYRASLTGLDTTQRNEVNNITLVLPPQKYRSAWPAKMRDIISVTGTLMARHVQRISTNKVDVRESVSVLEVALVRPRFEFIAKGQWVWYYDYKYTLPPSCNSYPVDSLRVRIDVLLGDLHIAGSPITVAVLG